MESFIQFMQDENIFPTQIKVLLSNGIKSYEDLMFVDDNFIGKIYSDPNEVTKMRIAIYNFKTNINKYRVQNFTSTTTTTTTATSPNESKTKSRASAANKSPDTTSTKVERNKVTIKPNAADVPNLKNSDEFKTKLPKLSMGKKCKVCHDISIKGHACVKCPGYHHCQYIQGHPEETERKKKEAKQISDLKKQKKGEEKQVLEAKKDLVKIAEKHFTVELPNIPVKEWLNLETRKFIELLRNEQPNISEVDAIKQAQEKSTMEWKKFRYRYKVAGTCRKEVKRIYTIAYLKEKNIEDLKNELNLFCDQKNKEYLDSLNNILSDTEKDEMDNMDWESFNI